MEARLLQMWRTDMCRWHTLKNIYYGENERLLGFGTIIFWREREKEIFFSGIGPLRGMVSISVRSTPPPPPPVLCGVDFFTVMYICC